MLRFLSVATPVTSSGRAVLGGQRFCRASADPGACICPREAEITFQANPFPKRLFLCPARALLPQDRALGVAHGAVPEVLLLSLCGHSAQSPVQGSSSLTALSWSGGGSSLVPALSHGVV